MLISRYKKRHATRAESHLHVSCMRCASTAAQIGRPGYTRPSSEAEFGLEIRCAPPPWVPRTRTRRGFLDRTPPGGWLAASLPIWHFCRFGRMGSGGLGSSFFVRFGKPPARLAFIPGQMGHTSPMTRRGGAKKGTADFGPFQSIYPQGRPCGDLSTDSPHARGPAWRCMWPLCSPGPG